MKRKLFVNMMLAMGLLPTHAITEQKKNVKDTLQVYQINGEQVSNFDGSQLAHHFVINYQIKVEASSSQGKPTQQIHQIETATDKSPLLILDGKIIPSSMISNLDKENIKSINVIKGDKEQAKLFSSYFGNQAVAKKNEYQGIVLVTSKDKEKSLAAYKKEIIKKQKSNDYSHLPQSYVIDGNKVPHFDGKQLENKNIKEYTISIDTLADSQPSLIATHHITLDKSIKIRGTGKVSSPQETTSKAKQKYILNGKPITQTDMEQIAPSSIKDITVIKAGSKAAIQYTPSGDNTYDYIIITTK